MKHQFNEANIVLSATDAEALILMLGEYGRGTRFGGDAVADLVDVVQIADIVAEGSALDDRVTMNSCIRYAEAGRTGGELTLAWPNAAAPGQGRVSVLSPMGIALLGRRAGDQVQVALPNGARRDLTITAVHAAREENAVATAD